MSDNIPDKYLIPEQQLQTPSNRYDNSVPEEYLLPKQSPTGTALLTNLASQADDPEEALATSGLIQQLSSFYNKPAEEIATHLDSAVENYYGKMVPHKTALKSILDSGKTGYATNKIGRLAGRAAWEDDPEKRALIFEQIADIEKNIPDPDAVKRGLPVQAMKDASELVGQMIDPVLKGVGAQAATLPFALYTGPLAAIITRVAPVLVRGGTTFYNSTRVEQGLLYKDLIESGVDHEVAAKYSLGNGIIAGALETVGVEVVLGQIPGLKEVVGKAIYKSAVKDAVTVALRKTLKDAGKKVAAGMLVGTAGETGTEVLQEYVNYKYEEIAKQVNNDINGTDISPAAANELLARLKEVALKTARGMAVIGGIGGAASITTTVGKNIKESSRQQTAKKKVIADKEAAKSESEKELSGLEKSRADIKAKFETDPTEDLAAELTKIDQQIKTHKENFETAVPDTDEMINLETEKKMILEDIEKQSESGKISPKLIMNLQAVQLQIDDLVSGIQEEEVTGKQPYQMTRAEYAESKATYTPDIENLGKTESRITQESFRSRIKETSPNLKDAEVDAIITLHSLRAESTGMDFETFLNTEFMSDIATDENIVGTLPQGNKGAVWFNNDAKALIVLTKKSDFSTWVHESGHIFRRQLEGDLKTQAENYYGVTDGNWNIQQEERFTEDLTTYLMTGNVPAEEMRSVFQIIADALLAIYRSLSGRDQVSPEIKEVFDQMFQTESSILFQPEEYFKQTETSIKVPVKNILPRTTKISAEKVLKAEGLMDSAAEGTGLKRDPLKVVPIGKNEYRVLDGNTTLSILKKNNIKDAIVEVVDLSMRHVNTFEENMAKAKDAREEFEASVNTIAEKYDALVNIKKGYKKEDRALQKIDEEYDGDAGKLLDNLAAEIIFEKSSDIQENIENIKNDFDTWRIKDKISKPQVDGFRCYALNIMQSNGNIGEVQIMTRAMWFAKHKGLGHSMYEVSRQLDKAQLTAEKTTNKTDYKRFEDTLSEITSLSKKYYDGIETGNEDFLEISSASFSEISTPVREILVRLSAEEIGFEPLRYSLTKVIESVSLQKAMPSYSKYLFDTMKPSTNSISQNEVENNSLRALKEKEKINSLFQPAQDEAYFKALKDGNFEAAQKIIDTVAREKGYMTDSEYRMSHEAPYKDDDNYNVNIVDLVTKTDTIVPSDYFTMPQYYMNSHADYGALYNVKRAMERYEKYKNGELKRKPLIRMYRAVDASVKEEKIRNGDWVTPSREYAVEHGKSNLDKYKIIYQSVPVDQVWWDANDINEWGVDDGKSYAYKNTKNNKKLTDVITRDYDGNIVPPSKRFNYRAYETFYQSEQDSEHMQAVQAAVERGVYVPDEVLKEYSDTSWAYDELETRVEYRKEAFQANDEEDFIGYMSAFEADRPQSYWREIYNSTLVDQITPEKRNAAFLESLDKHTLEVILNQIAHQGIKTTPPPFIEAAVKHVGKYGEIQKDSYYDVLMTQIKGHYEDRQLAFRKWVAQELEDTDELMLLENERVMLPEEGELEKLRAENKALRKFKRTTDRTLEELNHRIKRWQDMESAAKKKNITLEEAYTSAKHESALQAKTLKDQAKFNAKKEKILTDFEKKQIRKELNDRHAEYKHALRQRALMKKLIRIIMKKPPAACDVLTRKQIEAIQSKYIYTIGPKRIAYIEQMRNILEDLEPDSRSRKLIEKDINRQSLRAMSIDELTELAEKIVQMKKDGVELEKQRLLEIKESRLKKIDAVLSENPTNKKHGTFGRTDTGKEVKGNLVKNIQAYWWNMRRIADRLGETSSDLLVDMVNSKYEEYLGEVGRRQQSLFGKMKENNLTIKHLAKKEDIMGEEFTRNDLIGFYIAMQNTDSYNAIYDGNLYNHEDPDAFLEEVENRLSEEEKDFADWMIDSFSGEDRDRLFYTFIQDKNDVPKSVANYFPMKHQDINTDNFNYVQEIANDLTARTQFKKAYPSKKNLIKRIKIGREHQTPIRVDALGVYLQAIDQQEHYIANMQLVKDLQYIYNDKAVKDAIALNYGKEWNNSIQIYINNIANPTAYRNQLVQMKWWNKMISNGMASALMYNAVTMLKQTPSLAFFMREAGAAHIMMSQAEVAANYNKIRDFVYANAPQIKYRNIDDYMKNIKVWLGNPDAGKRLIAQIQNVGLKGIGYFDKVTVIIGWNAVYKNVFSKTGDHEAAVKAANDVFLRTQPQGHAKDSPRAYLDERLRPFLVFTRQLNQIFQMITADMPRALSEKKYQQIVYDLAALSLSGLLIGMINRKRPQKDEKEIAEDIVSQMAIGLPLIGGTISGMLQGNYYATQGVQIPITSAASQLYKSVQTVIDEDEDMEEKIEESIRLMTEAMKLQGLPGVLSWRAYKAYDNEDFRYLILGSLPKE